MFNQSLYDEKIPIDTRLLKLVKEAKEKVSKHFGIPKYLLDDVKLKVAKLPTKYLVTFLRIGNYTFRNVRKISKVLGMFRNDANEIIIDLSLYSLRKTVFHEFVHKAQAVIGKLGRLPPYMLEKEAYTLTNLLT